MSLDLTTLIESAADEVASAGRAAAGSINELVHDWGHETRSFVNEHAPTLPYRRSRRSGMSTAVRLLIPIAVLAVVAYVLFRRRGRLTPHLPERHHVQDEVHETVVGSAPAGRRAAEGAAAS